MSWPTKILDQWAGTVPYLVRLGIEFLEFLASLKKVLSARNTCGLAGVTQKASQWQESVLDNVIAKPQRKPITPPESGWVGQIKTY